MSDTVTRGSLYFGALQIVVFLSMVALHVGVARYLGPDSYGHFVTVLLSPVILEFPFQWIAEAFVLRVAKE